MRLSSIVVAVSFVAACASAGEVTVFEDPSGSEVRRLSGMEIRRPCRKCGAGDLHLEQVGRDAAELTLTGYFGVGWGEERMPVKWRGHEIRFVADDEVVARPSDVRWKAHMPSRDVVVERLTATIEPRALRRAAEADELDIAICEPSTEPAYRSESCSDRFSLTPEQIRTIRIFAVTGEG